MTGLAFVDGGWAKTAHGQLERATSIVDKVRRRLRPLWGPVWSDRSRGNAPWPRGTDAILVIVEDRIRFLLEAMIRSGEIADLVVTVTRDPNNAKRCKAVVSFLDEDRKPHTLTEFVRIP